MRTWWLLLGAACTEPTPALPTPTPAPVPVPTPPPPSSVTSGPPNGPRTWVQITGHPCAVDAQGWMECWWSDEPDWLGNTDDVTPQQIPVGARLYGEFGGPVIYAHAPDQLIQVVHCGVNPGSWPCFPPGIPYREANAFAGITASGVVHSWDSESDGPVVEHPGTGWSRLSSFVGSAAYHQATGVVGAAGKSANPHYVEFNLPPDTVVSQLVGGVNPTRTPYVGIYVLTTEGDILGFGSVDASVFSSPPYERIHGGMYARPGGDHTTMCAMRAGSHIIDCSNGDTHDFGPLRAFTTMHGSDFLSIPDGGTATTVHEENVCVITIDNAIHCVGRLYPPDLVEKLEALPR